MKWLLLFFLASFSFNVMSQIRLYNRYEKIYVLVAKNDKHEHWYRQYKALEITYKDSNGIVAKAKGRLFINDSTTIELHRHNSKIITIINPDNIISVQNWSGPALVIAGIAAGVGAAIAIPTLITLNNNSENLGLIFPAIVAAVDGYFVAGDLIIITVSQALSMRSQKKGYHFYITQW